MIRLNSSRGKVIVSSLFVLLVVSLQVVLYAEFSGITTEQVWLTTSEGIKINAEVYKPRSSSEPMPSIVVCHGLLASHQTMQSFSLEFAKRGFLVVAIDMRGHGDSGGSIDVSIDSSLGKSLLQDVLSMVSLGRYESKVELDVRLAVDYLRSRTDIDHDKIAVLGHSVGGAAAFREGYSDPRVKSVVAIAPALSTQSEMNITFPQNLLLVVGSRDNIVRETGVLKILDKTTGGGVVVGKLFGNFSEGTARKMIVSTGSDHAETAFDPYIVGEAIAWVEASLLIPHILPISISPWFNYLLPLSLSASFLSVFPAIFGVKTLGKFIRKGKPPQKPNPTHMGARKLGFIYLGAWGCGAFSSLFDLPVRLGIPLRDIFLFNWIPVVFIDLFAYAYVTFSIILLLVIMVFRRTKEKLNLSLLELRTSVALGILGFLIFSVLNAVFIWTFIDIVPTTRELYLMIELFIYFLPLTFLDELWVRNLQNRLPQKS